LLFLDDLLVRTRFLRLPDGSDTSWFLGRDEVLLRDFFLHVVFILAYKDVYWFSVTLKDAPNALDLLLIEGLELEALIRREALIVYA